MAPEISQVGPAATPSTGGPVMATSTQAPTATRLAVSAVALVPRMAGLPGFAD